MYEQIARAMHAKVWENADEWASGMEWDSMLQESRDQWIELAKVAVCMPNQPARPEKIPPDKNANGTQADCA